MPLEEGQAKTVGKGCPGWQQLPLPRPHQTPGMGSNRLGLPALCPSYWFPFASIQPPIVREVHLPPSDLTEKAVCTQKDGLCVLNQGQFLPLRRHLAVSGDSFDCHDLGFQHPVSRSQGCAQCSAQPECVNQPNVRRAKVRSQAMN